MVGPGMVEDCLALPFYLGEHPPDRVLGAGDFGGLKFSWKLSILS